MYGIISVMRYIEIEENREQIIENLADLIKSHHNHRVRKRAMAIKLSLEKKISIPMIVEIVDVKNRAIYEWFDRFDSMGIIGLLENRGRGRKSKIDDKKN